MATVTESFIIICAWCERVLNECDEIGLDTKYSHTICEDCFENLRPQIDAIHSEERVVEKLTGKPAN
jgi:hypothetical protein